MKKFLGCLLLGIHAVASGAASSVSIIERAGIDSSDGEQVIEIPSPGAPPVPQLELRKSSGGSRTRGSRVNLAAFCADLDRVGITSDDMEGAKGHIVQQLKTTTPRSTRTVDTLLQKLGSALEQRVALSESTGVRSTLGTTSSSAPNSDDDISTPLEEDDSESDGKILQKMLIQLHLANEILTQNAVVTQESLEQAEEAAITNEKQYRFGMVVGIIGTTLAVIFGAVAFIPPFVT
jgi:hypothetical protein